MTAMYQTIALLFAFVFAYGLVARRAEASPIGGAVLFTAVGLACGPAGLGILEMNVHAEELRLLAELTLALVLFTDAATANIGVARQNRATIGRLLLVGLPLTILLGWGVGTLLLKGLGVIEVAILATMLAPTDAALGLAVVSNPAVPAAVREDLNVESGLNDGICVPVLVVLLAFATEATSGVGSGIIVRHFAEEIGIGAVVGGVLAYLGARAIRLAAERNWGSEVWRQLPVISMALCSFATAQALGGSGFIACFVGGLLAGAMARKQKHEYLLAAEGLGRVLALVTWVAFGATVVGPALTRLTWQVAAYAALSLTVVRMLPVYLALAGLGMRSDAKLFIGWFGPRGLASIVFAVIVFQANLPGSETLTVTVAWTIILSILAHGLTAGPLAAAFARRVSSTAETLTPTSR
jgi:NhaP-type Na+/H+ or K+/H+ antiporter